MYHRACLKRERELGVATFVKTVRDECCLPETKMISDKNTVSISNSRRVSPAESFYKSFIGLTYCVV